MPLFVENNPEGKVRLAAMNDSPLGLFCNSLDGQ